MRKVSYNSSETDECEDTDWIRVAQDREQWRTVVHTAMEIGFTWKEIYQMSNHQFFEKDCTTLDGIQEHVVKWLDSNTGYVQSVRVASTLEF